MCNSFVQVTGAALSLVVALTVAYYFYAGRKRRLNLLSNPDVTYPIKLIDRKEISSDTRIFRFALHSQDQTLGLPLGQHVYLSARVNNQLVVRPYTPISPIDARGYVTFVIKVYKRGIHPKFPEGGKMTQHLDSLSIGDEVNVRGPSGLLLYEGQGCFAIKSNKTSAPARKLVRRVAMIAGGSGITPMYQLMQAMLQDPLDEVEIWLIYANKTEEDILLRKSLDSMSAAHPYRLKLWYTLDESPGRDWQYGTGFVSKEMIKERLPPADSDLLVLLCGPPPMINVACRPNLAALSYSADSIFVF